MPLPRNQQARNVNRHLKNLSQREITKRVNDLYTICDKHKIGNLTFKSCKLATNDGTITFIDHDEIRGNMRSGVLIIKATSVVESTGPIYDLVKFKNEKQQRELKKHEEDATKAKIELERLQKNTLPDTQSDENRKLLEKMVETENEAQQEKTDNDPPSSMMEQHSKLDESTEDDKASEELKEDDKELVKLKEGDGELEGLKEDDKELEGLKEDDKELVKLKEGDEELKEDDEEAADQKKSSKTDKKKRSKRETAIKNMNDQLMKKTQSKPERNKYYRNFMKDLKDKFALEKQEKFYYAEVRAETTDMVITNAFLYKISMPAKSKETYLLVVGDLQMKSMLIRQIDPNYQAEDVFQEHNDFLERIKAREKLKTQTVSEELVSEELENNE